MISPTLRGLATCPRCLLDGQADGDPPRLRAVPEAPTHQPDDRGADGDPPRLRVEDGATALHCPRCGARYPQPAGAGGAYLDLRPPGKPGGRETRYAADEEAFARALGYRSVGEPLLGAAVRNRWLRRWLPWGPGRLVLDVGCGDGRFALWNRDRGAHVVGLDAAPLFADAAAATIDLVRGDVRTLPFPAASFDAAYSIDVMEHLDAPGVDRFFAEVARVLRPGGAFYLYSNTRERSTIRPVVALWGRLSAWLRRRGVGDFQADDLRKSDHVKVLATWEQVVAVAAYHGLRVERVRYWNGVFQGLVDNVLVRVGEAVLLRRPGARVRPATPAPELSGRAGASDTRKRPSRQDISRRPAARLALRALTALMHLDVILFGALRSGPFFALFRKGDAPGETGP